MLTSLFATPARAQDVADGGQSSAYERLVADALVAYNLQDYRRARDLFREATGVQRSARALRAIAMCSYNLREPIDAILQLEAALEEPTMPLAEQQRVGAMELLHRAEQKVAFVEVVLAPETAIVTVDGETPRRNARGVLLVLPGTHRMLGLAPEHITQQLVVNAVAGEYSNVRFELHRAAGHSPQVASSPRKDLEDHANASSIAQRVVLGVGASGLALSAVTMGLAAHEQAVLRESCYKGVCAPSSYDQLDRYNRLKVAATVGFVTASVLLAADLVWWLYSRHHATRSKAQALAPVNAPGTTQ